ncbi:MAG: DUF4297 domain-containing protein [Acidobacteriia bacterium]|nr:DUF4297 domain-containing protein [Terriglobia bacterium]
MAIEIGNLVPPDDTGADTSARFRFQAEVAFPFCLNCAIGGNIKSVVMEHFEDIAIEESARWRFQQIKTRNVDRGPWRLSDILQKHGGGIHTLFRTYQVIKDHANIRLELILEGALKLQDAIQQLRRNEATPETLKKIQDAVEGTFEEVSQFVSKLHVLPYHRYRNSIEAQNLLLLGQHAKHLTAEQTKSIYDKIIERILEAMHVKLDADDWEEFCLTLEPLSDHQVFQKKRLTPEILKPLFGPITSKAGTLLRQVIEPEKAVTSPLEQKLIIGGAPPQLISVAKSLRAHAVSTELEQSSASLFADAEELLEDVRQRLLSRAVAISIADGNGPNPASNIWTKLMDVLTANREIIDKHDFFEQDVELLMGELCELSDQCRFDWGNVDA